MGELLSKKVLAEIEHRKAYQYGSMVSLTVAERDALVAHVRALEAERDEKAGVAEVYYNTMTSYENDNRELRARLREVEVGRDQAHV